MLMGTELQFFKPRPLPYDMRKKVEEELQRLEQDQVIEPLKYSDWAAPIVPVLKPNGQVRICCDYKVTVNKAFNPHLRRSDHQVRKRFSVPQTAIVTCVLPD